MLDTTPPIVTPRVDKRLQQRRAEVRRQEGRRRLRLVLGALTVTGLWAGAWAASVSPLLDVDKVEVHGAVRATPDGLTSSAGLRTRMRMVDVDAGRAEAALEGLPWVRSAEVQRRWPGTVRIDVAERVPAVALANQAGGWALADPDGRVVAWEAPGSLPRLEGLPPAGPPGSRLPPTAIEVLGAATTAPPMVLERVESFAPSPGGGVEARLRPQGIARLGGPDQLQEKFVVIETVLSRVDSTDLDVLDVRVPRSPVLTRLQQPE